MKQGLLLAAGLMFPVMAMSSPLPDMVGLWQCVPEEVAAAGEQSWVRYDFRPDGTIKSQEWIRYQEEKQTKLEYNLFVDYRYKQTGQDYVLKPLQLSRKIITDTYNTNPFDYDQRRDLTGYRIFFKPILLSENKAQFDMWYHITPAEHFTMQCQRQIS
ncbi:hypothetical protein L4D76_13165 [Photobacterium sagamiensis]|uniref:hypothetical protein n=1 Tax=Photobacterium sagamiensis TaxID=2910241 RepID=UPI003D0A619F